MTITARQLTLILPKAPAYFLDHLNKAMAWAEVNTPARIAAFLAQTGHESNQFTKMKESMNYSVEGLLGTFSRSRISKIDAERVGRTAVRPALQAEIGNLLYGGAWGKKNLGNTEPNDGIRYIARGPIGITGRANYTAAGKALGLDLVNHPELLEQPHEGLMSSAWYWKTNKLNALADAGKNRAIGGKINTGDENKIPLRAEEREALYVKALKVLTS